MPIQAPQWTEFLTCPVCCNEFDGNQRSPISLACSHTICHACLANLHKKQCPFDQSQIKTEVSGLPVNGALLQLVSSSSSTGGGGPASCPTGSPPGGGVPPLHQPPTATPLHHQQAPTLELPPCLNHLSIQEREAYFRARTAIEQLALYLKPFSSVGGVGGVSRPMQRKLVTLVNCQLAEEEGRCRAMRAARSLGDRTVTELILYHQNPGHLSANLWAAVRARGCQFLGPAMQEEVLKLVLLALEDGTALSRKVLVMFVVQRLEPHFPQASKTSIGHVVQLLYRASCFKVSKREGDSSLMQLKEEFRSYEALRREHDAQIVQIATEAGLRIAPDQWSALLYGDSAHKSHMQSIMDKLQSPGSFGQSVQELVIALQRSGDPGSLANLRPHLEHLASIDPNPEVCTYRLSEVAEGLEACRLVVGGLVEFMRSHGGGGGGGSGGGGGGGPGTGPGCGKASPGEHSKYKVSLCRDLSLRGSCPRGSNCTFAHSDDELDKFRSKNRKAVRTLSGSLKEDEVHPHEDILFCNDANMDYPGFPVGSPPGAGFVAGQHPQAPYQQPQPPLPAFPTDIFNSPRHSNVMVRGGYSTGPPLPQEPKSSTVWRRQPHYNNSKRVASSLAVLHHRKQEVLNQLERVLARCNNNPLPQDVPATGGGGTNYSVWNSSGSMVPSSPPLLEQPLISHQRPILYRSDSGLTEEEFIPFDPPIVSKFGPISREGTKPQSFTEPPPQVAWLFNSPHGGYLSDLVQQPGMREGYIAVDVFHPNAPDLQPPPHSDFLVESQKMKLQLRTLEKKINDLKLATEGGAALTEGEKLSQELQLIEQGIREREHQLRMCSQNPPGLGGVKSAWNGDNWPQLRPDEEDSYEAGIANDIRELELRWEYELEEQEKRWSSEEESHGKK